MKRQLKSSIILIFVLLMACGEITQTTPAQDMTSLPVSTSTPSKTAEYVIESTPTQFDPLSIPLPTFSIPDGTNIPFPTPDPRFPTLLPTIDPALVASLLRQSLHIQILDGVNGHNIMQITGWNYGFSCTNYQWLDLKHLLLYPRIGQEMVQVYGSLVPGDLKSEPVIINLTNGTFWLLPLSDTFSFDSICNSVYWSQKLGMIMVINQENNDGALDLAKDSVFTYSFDGQKIAQYKGKISGVSPSSEKILVNDKTVIDLRTNKITDLNWQIRNDPAIPPNFFVYSDPTLPINLYWSSDETRLYRCCFYYADLKSGKSHNFNWDDLHRAEGGSSPTPVIPHTHGQWVGNDDFFLVEWNYFSDMSADYIPLFNLTEMKYYDLVSIAGMPKSSAYISSAIYTVAPDGGYIWITGFGYDGKYYDFLVNLTTFETFSYDKLINDITWSPDSKFTLMTISDINTTLDSTYVFSVVENTLTAFPTNLTTALFWSWRPSDHILAYITKQNQTLNILDAKDMSVKEWTLPSTFHSLIWSPDGSHIALMATDGSLWQIDYPKMENLEQLTRPIPDVKDISWSPDGNSISFISGSDIYIVDTIK